MRRLLILTSILMMAFAAYAEDSIPAVADTLMVPTEDTIAVAQRPNLLDSMPNVQVVQDSAVFLLLQAAMTGQQEFIEIDGYRVQVYSSNQQQTAKTEALELEKALRNDISQPVHVLYMPPFWKVRIGDFRTYNEAKEYKKIFVQLYPRMMGDTYIVRDKIKVPK